MSIIVTEQSRVLIQGITGKIGRIFAERMIHYRTPLVAGVTPGKGSQRVAGVPVYNSVYRAVRETEANTSLVLVPPVHVKSAVFEAIDAGIETIIVYTEGVPVHDSVQMVEYAKQKSVRLFGPNSAGVVSPGKANLSDMDDSILMDGDIGIVSKSGTLTYEVVELLKQHSLGVSTIICLGGDPIIGVQHHQILTEFEKDRHTSAVIYIGEIGGNDESLAAQVISSMSKPVIAYIAGRYAPRGKRMGHAGAIINQVDEDAQSKQRILRESGAKVADILTQLPDLLGKRKEYHVR